MSANLEFMMLGDSAQKVPKPGELPAEKVETASVIDAPASSPEEGRAGEAEAARVSGADASPPRAAPGAFMLDRPFDPFTQRRSEGEIRNAYRLVFMLPEGQAVLADLCRFAGLDQDVPDNQVVRFMGMRRLLLRMLAMSGIAEGEVMRRLRAAHLQSQGD